MGKLVSDDKIKGHITFQASPSRQKALPHGTIPNILAVGVRWFRVKGFLWIPATVLSVGLYRWANHAVEEAERHHRS